MRWLHDSGPTFFSGRIKIARLNCPNTLERDHLTRQNLNEISILVASIFCFAPSKRLMKSKGQVRVPKEMNFRKTSKGRGRVSFSIQKLCCTFWNLLRLFEHEFDTKESFQGSGYAFSTIVLRKIKTRHTLKKALLNSDFYLAIIPPRIYATITKKFAI